MQFGRARECKADEAEQMRKLELWQVIPTVFIRAVCDPEHYTEFVIGSAWRGICQDLNLLKGVDEKTAATFRPKGEVAKRLCTNSVRDIKYLCETGKGEEDYRIATKDFFNAYTNYPYLALPIKKYGLFVRGVLIEAREHCLTNEEVENYLSTHVETDDLASVVYDMRKFYRMLTDEIIEDRKRKLMNKQRQRERDKENLERVKDDCGDIVDGADVDRVLTEIKKFYPRCTSDANRNRAAVMTALSKIPADDLIKAASDWVHASERQNKELKYYPSLANWLNGEKWRDVEFEKKAGDQEVSINQCQCATSEIA